jgi:hypothetical protein
MGKLGAASMPPEWRVGPHFFPSCYPASAHANVVNQAPKNTIQDYCQKYKDVIAATDENCNGIFNGNNMKITQGYVFFCNGARVVASNIPITAILARLGAHFLLSCDTNPITQLNAGLHAAGSFLHIVK